MILQQIRFTDVSSLLEALEERFDGNSFAHSLLGKLALNLEMLWPSSPTDCLAIIFASKGIIITSLIIV